jgi:chaperonin cofactor prefoldin
MAYCKNCGSPLKPQDKFCEACGRPIEVEEPAAPVYEAPPAAPVAPKYAAPPAAPYKKRSNVPVIILSCILAVVLIGSAIGIISMSGTISDLRAENEELVAANNQLTSALNAANNTIISLNNELTEANSEINELTSDLNEASITINDLNSDLAEVQSNLSAANATIADLNEEKEGLAEEKSQLEAELSEANELVSSLNSIIDIMDANYSEILEFIEIRFGLVEDDARQFITPNDETVGELVDLLVTPFDGDWDKAWNDFLAMFYWVYNNVEYSYDSPLPVLPPDLLEGGDIEWFGEFWQYPVETIYFGHGDCEDQALLLTSMIKNYGEGNTYAYCIGISNGDSGHMAVALPVTDNRMVIFDPTGSYYSAEWSGEVAFWDVTSALQDWLEWWSDQIPGAEVTMFFDEEDYFEFDGNDDFLDWYLS